jgi:hypothetical protein
MAIALRRVLFAATMAALVSIPAANAQFGEMPGTGDPGLGVGAPPAGPPPACQQLFTLRDDTQKSAAAIKTYSEKAHSQNKPPDPVEVCKLFKVFLANESKFIRGMTDNRTACGVPPDTIKAAQEDHGKASQIQKQVCDAAERSRQAERPRQAGWLLSCEIAKPARATDRVLCSEPSIKAYGYFLGPGY